MFFGTIAAANYLPRAACLVESLKRTQPDHTFGLCLVERDRSAILDLEKYFPEVILASELGVHNFESFIFRHQIMEACTAVKAQFLMWAMNRFREEERFVFLDPDIMAYSRFEEVEAIFPQAQIMVTPHQVDDEESLDAVRDNQFRGLVAGTFNLGFLGLRRSQTAHEFLTWWNGMLQNLCYMEWSSRGLFVDQKWVLLGLSFFDMTVVREPGYNVANWNVSRRSITKHDHEDQYLVNGKPLRFFHFSNTESARDLYSIRRHLLCDSPIFELRDTYLHQVESLDLNSQSRVRWSYGSFRSGEIVHDEVRRVYRDNPQLIERFPEPFDESSSTFYSAMAERSADRLRKSHIDQSSEWTDHRWLRRVFRTVRPCRTEHTPGA